MTEGERFYDWMPLQSRTVPRAQLTRAGLLFCWLCAAGQSTRAQAPDGAITSAHLRWERPVGSTCIGQEALQERVEVLLGRRVFVADAAAELRIAGSVERQSTGWLVTLRVVTRGDGDAGVRELRQEGPDCAALNSALTVVLATLIDLARPDLALDGGPSFVLGAAGAYGWGLLPGGGAGGSLMLGLRPSAVWSSWLDVSAWLPVEKLDASQRGGAFSAWHAGLSLCRDARATDRVELAACAGGQLGAILGQGRGLGPNRGSQQLLAQARLEGALSLRLVTAVALRASAAGTLALSRPSFFIEEPDAARSEVFRPALLGLLLRVGLTVALK
jgi:hypothetical protein